MENNTNQVAELTEEQVADLMYQQQLTKEEIQEKINAVMAEIAKLKGGGKAVDSTKKNKKPGKPNANRKYVLLSDKLASWGLVPRQQADIAKILAHYMEVGKEYSEAEVFGFLVDGAGEYESIYKSEQDPTYLFRYYRGLKKDGKHAGFVARNFIQQIG
jgi:hypothetical protein